MSSDEDNWVDNLASEYYEEDEIPLVELPSLKKEQA